jgi:hypothetical protein
MLTNETARKTGSLVGKAQCLLLRIGIDDNLTALLLLAVGAGLVALTVKSRRQKTVYVDPVGSTFIQKERLQ